MKEQIELYKAQLDVVEEALYKTDGSIPKTIEILNEDGRLGRRTEHSLYVMWCLNICALIKMKVIENDNMNGILKTTKKD